MTMLTLPKLPLAPKFKHVAALLHKNAASLLPIPWDCSYRLSECEYGAVIPSIQEFQLGESSEGKHLYHAAQQ